MITGAADLYLNVSVIVYSDSSSCPTSSAANLSLFVATVIIVVTEIAVSSLVK